MALIFFGVLDKKESSATYTDYYAKETARLINYARPGDVITIDIHDATKIAKKNGVTSDSEIVSFEVKRVGSNWNSSREFSRGVGLNIDTARSGFQTHQD